MGDTRRESDEQKVEPTSPVVQKATKEWKTIHFASFCGPVSSEECRTCKTPPIFQEVISVWTSSNEHVPVDALWEAPYVEDLAEDGYLSNGMTM